LLAEAYLGSGRLIKAREVAEQAVSGNPDDYDAYRILAAVLITVRDLDQALVQVQKLESIAQQAVAANPGDFQSLQRLGDAWRIHQQALRERLGELVVVGPDGVPTDEVLPGKSEEAAEITRRMVELMLLQSEAQRIAQLFEIVEVSAQALEYAPDSPRQWRDHGLLLMEIQRYAEARDAFQKVLELDPSDGVAQQQLSAINAMQGVPSDEAPAQSSASGTSTSPLNP
jgi:tetratricopeptide (TPR) repeat protein